YYNGAMTEIRISNVVRTASWIQATYNNQSAPAAFGAFGPTAMVANTTNQSSPIAAFSGNVYDSVGPSSIADTWNLQSKIGNGTVDSSSIFTFSHVGTTGVAAVQVPQLDVGATDTGISRLGAASFAMGNGTAGDFSGSLELTGLNVQGSITGPYSVSLTARTATIAATNLVTTPVTTALYEITYYLNDTTAGTSGTVSLTITWNDGAAQSVTSSNITFGTLGAYVSGVFVVKATSGAIQYATTVTSAVGSPAYSLDLRVKQLA